MRKPVTPSEKAILLTPGQPESKAWSEPESARPSLPSPRLRAFLASMGALLLCFSIPIYSWLRYALATDPYSYVLLIPFVSLYLLWPHRQRLLREAAPNPRLALFPLLMGLGVIGSYFLAVASGWRAQPEVYLGLMFIGFSLFGAAIWLFFLGPATLRTVTFPLAFLFCAVPLPDAWLQSIVYFLQHRSADVASALFSLSGMPFLRDDTLFRLPDFSLEVAPECSGIRSTLVLFITSLLAGYLFLRSPWKRALLTLVVVPLALLRNGFRIVVIGQLCVHVSHDMIHSPIHKQGGPLFFALSLIPFFLLLLWLRRGEPKAHQRPSAEISH